MPIKDLTRSKKCSVSMLGG